MDEKRDTVWCDALLPHASPEGQIERLETKLGAANKSVSILEAQVLTLRRERDDARAWSKAWKASAKLHRGSWGMTQKYFQLHKKMAQQRKWGMTDGL